MYSYLEEKREIFMALQQDYLKCIEKLAEIKELYSYPDFEADLKRFRERLLDKEFRIAVVGEFSSGKSTFINAILGKDILNHATTETTAVVTRIINVPENDTRVNKGNVYFKNGKILTLDNFSKLKEYTTTLSVNYKVVDEIERVDIFVPAVNSSADVVIVDTPGLNGMADGHREITIDIIKRAHACIYLLQKRGLTETDITFIKYLLNYQRNFIFIQNFIDELRSDEGETAEEKVLEQKKILEKNIFAEQKNAKFSICGISALLKLASADFDIPRLYTSSTHDLTEAERKDLAQKSRFDSFEKIMEDQFKEENLTSLQYGDTAWAINNWLQELLKYIELEHKHAEDALKEAQEQSSIKRLELLKNKINNNIPKHKKYLENYIVDKVRYISKDNLKNIEDSINRILRETFAKINSCKKINELDKVNEELTNNINNSLDLLNSEVITNLKNSFGALYQIVLAQVSEYSGIKCKDFPKLEIYNERSKLSYDNVINDRAHRLQRQLEESRETEFSLQVEQERIEKDTIDAAKEVIYCRQELADRKQKKQDDLNRLGRRPDKREYEEEYTYYRDRTGFGSSITNWLFGQKKCTGYRTVQDDSAGKAWDAKKQEILNIATKAIDRITSKKGAAERRLTRLSKEKESQGANLARIAKEIEELNRQLEIQKATDELAMKKAEREYLSNRIKNMEDHIKKYFDEIASRQIQDNMDSELKNQRKELIAWALERYREAVQQKLSLVEQCKLEKAPELQSSISNLKSVIKKINGIIKNTRCKNV